MKIKILTGIIFITGSIIIGVAAKIVFLENAVQNITEDSKINLG